MALEKSKNISTVLLVDDSKSDQITISRALEEAGVNCELHIVENGIEALHFLRNEAPYEDIKQYPHPHLTLMDINMPIMDGLSALKEIRADKELGTLAVVMLTTSESPNDINSSYSAGANAYITKPTDENDFVEAAKKIEGFWFQLVLLPNQKTKHILE